MNRDWSKYPIVRTRGGDQVLEDVSLQSPIDQALRRKWKHALWLVLAIIVAIFVVRLIHRFAMDRPVAYVTDEEHFFYGSIGAEPGGSVLHPVGGMLPPYRIFAVLPDMFPDKLPGGYASLGMIYENDREGRPRELPIGISRRQRFGMEMVGFNCAVCHVGTYRARQDAARQIVPGMPSHQLDLQGLFRFVLGTVLDPRFTADNVVGHVERKFGRLGFVDRLLLKASVPQVRERTLQLQSRVGDLFSPNALTWGPGRVDTFNPYKALQFNWPLDRLPARELAAASDFPSLWNQQPREGLSLHWDGNNSSLDERNLSAGLGAGITPVTADHPAIARIKSYISTLPAPRWPEAAGMRLDHAAAARGAGYYGQSCARCHSFGAPDLGQVVPLDEIGTDRGRFDSYTTVFADNQNTLFEDTPYRFRHFHKTLGYVSQPLDGIWARAPYLHNGSVPTLADLLEPPEKRPKQFYRGCDVYDAERVGFVSTVASEGGHQFFLYKAVDDAGKPVPGNTNTGHLYGTDLPAEAKRDLLEYLKTL